MYDATGREGHPPKRQLGLRPPRLLSNLQSQSHYPENSPLVNLENPPSLFQIATPRGVYFPEAFSARSARGVYLCFQKFDV